MKSLLPAAHGLADAVRACDFTRVSALVKSRPELVKGHRDVVAILPV
jgi:hypothetical protein